MKCHGYYNGLKQLTIDYFKKMKMYKHKIKPNKLYLTGLIILHWNFLVKECK